MKLRFLAAALSLLFCCGAASASVSADTVAISEQKNTFEIGKRNFSAERVNRLW